MGTFGIKTSNEQELYDFLQQNYNINFEEKECSTLEWTLKANIYNVHDGFEMTTTIKKKKKDYFPKLELKKELKDYNITPELNCISLDEDDYSCSFISEKKEYIIEMDYFGSSFSDFQKMLSKNNEFLEKMVKAHCQKNTLEVPEFEYLLNYSKLDSENPLFKSIEAEIEIKNFDVSFEDIGGNHEGKREMNRILQDIIHPDVAMLFGRDPQKAKGYLLYGEKGNGKTMLVKALAANLKNELKDKIKLYQMSYGNISSIFRGGEAEKIKDLFELIKSNEKKGLTTLVFMDELQSIGIRKFDSNEVLDELLANLGGLNSYKKLVFIGATYCPKEQLDEALIRPGRLGKHIEIKMPTIDERKEIMQIYLKKETEFIKKNAEFEGLFGSIDIDAIAKETEGYNGSDIMMLFESVRHKKEEETLGKFQKFDNIKKIKESIIPIATKDFLDAIRKGLKKNESRNIYM
jgi:ATP-dependent 26S proteasome regulatory subunit